MLVRGYSAFSRAFSSRSPRPSRRARKTPIPNHVVKIVLPVLPGSTTDILARLVANQLSEKWGKPVIVENMPGAAMNIGSEYVAHAAPDGYTLLLCPPSPLAIQQLLYHNLKYDPTKFVPIALLTKIANVLDVRPKFPAKQRARTDRLRQGQSRQAHLRLAGRRLDRAAVGQPNWKCSAASRWSTCPIMARSRRSPT